MYTSLNELLEKKLIYGSLQSNSFLCYASEHVQKVILTETIWGFPKVVYSPVATKVLYAEIATIVFYDPEGLY